MKTRQKRAQILEFESGTQEQWQEFIEKNAPLLKSFILHFSTPPSDELAAVCAKLGLLYVVGSSPAAPNANVKSKLESLLKSADSVKDSAAKESSTPESILPQSALLDSSAESSKDSRPITLIQKVRSGEEITLGHGIILGDVAHGAHIHASGDLVVFGDCAGVVQVDGARLILRNLTSGHIIFGGSILPAPIIAKINANSHLKIIIKNSDTIAVKEIF